MQNDEPQNPNQDQDLDQLIEQYSNSIEGKLWRGSHANRHSNNVVKSVCTGYKSINKQLHSNGWPLKTTTELGINQAGIGELRLLLPALKKLQSSQQQREIILISPPHPPFAPALHRYGIDVNCVTIVNTKNLQERLWATEQSLVANCCAAVISWFGEHKINHHELRRLQLASEKTSTWNVLFRHNSCLQQSSAAGLRIHLNSTAYSKLQLDIIKQPNGWGGQRCIVSLAPHYENWQRIPSSLLPVHQRSKPLKPAKQQHLKNEPATELSNAREQLHQGIKLKPHMRTREHSTLDGAKAEEQQNLSQQANQQKKKVAHPKIWHGKVSLISAVSEIRSVH